VIYPKPVNPSHGGNLPFATMRQPPIFSSHLCRDRPKLFTYQVMSMGAKIGLGLMSLKFGEN
jgi:hypothetical protein